MCECKQVVDINKLQVHEERIQSTAMDKADKYCYFLISYIKIKLIENYSPVTPQCFFPFAPLGSAVLEPDLQREKNRVLSQ